MKSTRYRHGLWLTPAVALMLVASCGSDSSTQSTAATVVPSVTESTDTPTSSNSTAPTDVVDTVTDTAATVTAATEPTTSPDTSDASDVTSPDVTSPDGSTSSTGSVGGLYSDPDGRWSAAFPAKPTEDSSVLANGIHLARYQAAVGSDQYLVANSTDDPASINLQSFDLDASVKGVVDAIGGTMTNTTPTTVDGFRALRYSGTATKGGQSASIEGLTVVTATEFIEVLVIDVDQNNATDAKNFIDSFMTTSSATTSTTTP